MLFLRIAVSKCLKVVNSTVQPVSLGDALVACSIDTARLVALQSCSQMNDMVAGIFNQVLSPNQSYFVGLSTYSNASGITKRNWEQLAAMDS